MLIEAQTERRSWETQLAAREDYSETMVEIQGVRGLTVTIQTVSVCLCCECGRLNILFYPSCFAIFHHPVLSVGSFVVFTDPAYKPLSSLAHCLLEGSCKNEQQQQRFMKHTLKLKLKLKLRSAHSCAFLTFVHRAVENDVTSTAVTSLFHTICRFNQRLQTHDWSCHDSQTVWFLLFYIIYSIFSYMSI